jgi:hypothetical protein
MNTINFLNENETEDFEWSAAAENINFTSPIYCLIAKYNYPSKGLHRPSTFCIFFAARVG